MSTTFISAEVLQDKLYARDPIVIIDSRFYLDDKTRGLVEYLQAHIANAIYADLEEDLSGPITATSGRHPLPDLATFKYWLANNGVSPKKEIIVYDSAGGGHAARLWFMLRQLGYKVYVLEGGIHNFLALDFQMSTGREIHTAIDSKELDGLPKSWDDGEFELVDINQILNYREKPDVVIVDSRSPERYSGAEEPIDPVAGRIPGSVNLHWESNLETRERANMLISRERLEEKFNFGDKKRVFYCGSGVTSCFNLLINEHLGNKNGSVYIGSFSEWLKLQPNDIEKD